MEVVVPMAAAQDLSAPSSPKPFGNPSDYFYASAPASPSRTAAIYARIFGWEDESSTPKPSGADDAREFDFALAFDSRLQRKASTTNLAAADELFEKGRIRPPKPPDPHLHHDHESGATPSSPQGGGAGSKPPSREVKDRGRTLSTLSTGYSRSRRWPRSLSPIRGSAGGGFHNSLTSSTTNCTTYSSSSSLSKGTGGNKRWRLKDLLLFRSGSEGRVRGSKDPLRKYTMLSSPLPSLSNNKRRSGGEDAKKASSEATDKDGSIRRGSGSAAASAHEKHYTVNRAASEELKKKTPLPFHRHGLFGYLSFNPAVHSVTRGFFRDNPFSRGRS